MKQQPFTLDHLLRIQRVEDRTPLHLSPDGHWLAVTVQRTQRDMPTAREQRFSPEGVSVEMIGSRVLVIDTTTGTAREPFPPGSTSWSAQWSPDGSLLAAYVQHEGQACLGIWNVVTHEARLLQHVLVRPVFGFEVPQWTPNSQAVVLKLVPTDATSQDIPEQRSQKGAVSGVKVFSFDPDRDIGLPQADQFFDWYRCDLGRVDVATGEVRKLATAWSFSGWRVAPDGQAVAVLCMTEFDPTRTQFYQDLLVVPLDGAPPRTVASHIPQAYGIGFSWSPDSRLIAYTTSEQGQPSRLFIIPSDGSAEPDDLSSNDSTNLSHEYEVPRWSANGQYIYCLTSNGVWMCATDGSTRRIVTLDFDREIRFWLQRPLRDTCWLLDGTSLVYIIRDPETKNEGLAQVRVDDGQGMVLTEFAQTFSGDIFGMEVALDGSACYFVTEAADHPPEIWCAHGDLRVPQRLYSLNPDLDDVALGASRLIAWRALNGEQRQGALLLPPYYTEGQPLPVIVQIYGDYSGSNLLHRFGFDGYHADNAQLLASRGYAVLWPDVPLEDHDPLRQLPGHVLPAVNQLIDTGIADANRIGLMGHSYGGYCVLALLTQTRRFRAAICSAGMVNLTSFYGILTDKGDSMWLGWCETGQGRLGGTPWDNRAAYIENSPLFYLDRVRTPLLLISGTAHSGELSQSEEAFSALRRLGQRVELRLYQGEDHWPGFWSEASLRDLCECVLDWFDTML